MSQTQKETLEFLSKSFLRIAVGVCSFLITLLFIEMRSDIKVSGNDITTIKERLARIEAIIK